MNKADRRTLILVLFGVVLLIGGMPFLNGAFYIGKHEGDTMHLAEIVVRMAAGEWPHLDIMTPIGILAFAPIALFVKLGAGLGHAIFLAQVLVALLLLPAVLRVAASRIGGRWGILYGGFVMLLCVALVHGEAEQSTSISMHYNRWAWAIAYVAVPLAWLAPLADRRPRLDGIIIGLCMAALVLMKATYFVSLAPAVLIALVARREWTMILWAALAGLAVAGAVTLAAGPNFWLAYARDLAIVASSTIRGQPGFTFVETVTLPAFIGGSLALLAGIILLRQGGRSVEGMVLLFLMPGFFYIVYQNYGNDPQWLLLLALGLFVLLPPQGLRNGLGLDLRETQRIVAIVALAFAAPSVINLAYSPFRHLAVDTGTMVPLLPAAGQHGDLLANERRLYSVDYLESKDGPGDLFATYAKVADRPEPATLNGEPLDRCTLNSGFSALFTDVAADLTARGYAGRHILVADLLGPYWGFGDFPAVPGAAPWYYGGLQGAEDADFVLVPLCPIDLRARAAMLSAFDEAGWTLTEIARTPLYILAAPQAP